MILKRVSGDIYDAIQIHLKTWPIRTRVHVHNQPCPYVLFNQPNVPGLYVSRDRAL
jgi:hypothetical protein